MKTVLFLAQPDDLASTAYTILEEMWNSHRIECLYKHVSTRRYKRWPDKYDLGINYQYKYEIPHEQICKNWVTLKIGIPHGSKNEHGALLRHNMESPILSNFFLEPQYTYEDIIQRQKECLFRLFFLYVLDLINKNKQIYNSIKGNK